MLNGAVFTQSKFLSSLAQDFIEDTSRTAKTGMI